MTTLTAARKARLFTGPILSFPVDEIKSVKRLPDANASPGGSEVGPGRELELAR